MSWCWLDLVDEPPANATAKASVFDLDGRSAGWLAAWRCRARPSRGARRVDDRIVDPAGEGAWISLVRPPDGVHLPFDDVAVQHARRRVLAEPPADAVSTLLSDDPFARVFPAHILRVDAGQLGRVPPPCGPTIERYGSAQPWPWPWDRYDPDAA